MELNCGVVYTFSSIRDQIIKKSLKCTHSATKRRITMIPVTLTIAMVTQSNDRSSTSNNRNENTNTNSHSR